MTALESVLATYCATGKSEKEKGFYIEERIRTYFRYVVTPKAKRLAAETAIYEASAP